MEKNLPFDLPIADKAYNDRVLPFLTRLDDGDVFKNLRKICSENNEILHSLSDDYKDSFTKKYI